MGRAAPERRPPCIVLTRRLYAALSGSGPPPGFLAFALASLLVYATAALLRGHAPRLFAHLTGADARAVPRFGLDLSTSRR